VYNLEEEEKKKWVRCITWAGLRGGNDDDDDDVYDDDGVDEAFS
jgi:hypothetical protein